MRVQWLSEVSRGLAELERFATEVDGATLVVRS